MTRVVAHEHRKVSQAGRTSAFTLVELLVVIGIIALLISILLPSLARAREQGRAAQCLSGLKQMGTGMVMYGNENRGSLPGPIHFLVYYGTSSWEGKGSTDAYGNQGKLWAQRQLPYLIGRYLGDKKAKNLDAIARCPTRVWCGSSGRWPEKGEPVRGPKRPGGGSSPITGPRRRSRAAPSRDDRRGAPSAAPSRRRPASVPPSGRR